MSLTDQLLQSRVERAREASIRYLESLRAPGLPPGVSRVSEQHDAALWPQMLLPGTYDSLMARDLLGALPEDRQAVGEWLLGQQQPDGTFLLANHDWSQCHKRDSAEETKQYMRFHLTNYSMGALDALGMLDRATLSFVEPFLDETFLWAWLGRRDMRDPWLEGNNIVNLGSFLLVHAARRPDGPAMKRLRDLVHWHNTWSEPYSGFWGSGQQYSAEALLFALCGATHNLHIFYALNEPIPHFNQSISRCLEQPLAIRSACIDVDIVDILAHGMARCPHRNEEIAAWLRAMLKLLLDFQNPDGGFADALLGQRGLDGWVKGYKEAQGKSNTFATWFRWIAIAQICAVLWPGWRTWNFRRTIGVGYF